MRIESPRIALFILFWVSSVMFLGACVKPVGVDSLIKDPKVQGLIPDKGGEVGIDIKFEMPPSFDPEIGRSDELERDIRLVIHLGDPDIYISVKNHQEYESGSIKWYIDNDEKPLQATPGMPELYIVRAGTSPFNKAKLYQLTVVGIKDGILYSTYIFIKVED